MSKHPLVLAALERIPTPVLISDRKGNIEYLNQAFTKMTGYSPHDLVGKNPKVLSAGKTPPRVYKKLWETILSGNIWHGELYNHRKDGSVYLEAIYIAPIKDLRGRITHFIASWQDITKRKQLEDRLRKRNKVLGEASLHDDLTGLYNRYGFFMLMEHQAKISYRQKKESALFYIDLDNLKQINDSFGHLRGDNALVATAAILEETFRASDIVARIGGDEFVATAVDVKKGGIKIMVDRLRANFDRFNQMNPHYLYQLQFSFGAVTMKPGKKVDIQALLEKADRLMYQQKSKKYRTLKKKTR